jgi:hypothetical protein
MGMEIFGYLGMVLGVGMGMVICGYLGLGLGLVLVLGIYQKPNSNPSFCLGTYVCINRVIV